MFVVPALQQMVTGLQCYVCNGCNSPINLQSVPMGIYSYSCTVSNDTCLFIEVLLFSHRRNIL